MVMFLVGNLKEEEVEEGEGELNTDRAAPPPRRIQCKEERSI